MLNENPYKTLYCMIPLIRTVIIGKAMEEKYVSGCLGLMEVMAFRSDRNVPKSVVIFV